MIFVAYTCEEPKGMAGSLSGDHQSYYLKMIPYIQLHDDHSNWIHTPKDNLQKLNLKKIMKVSHLSLDLAFRLANYKGDLKINKNDWLKTYKKYRLLDHKY